jgi:PKD repeat protein
LAMKPFCILSLCLLFQLFPNKKSNAQPFADFNASHTSGCSPIVVNFTDLSTGNPAEWRWDLGNGTVSTLQNPSTTYITPGLYTVKLWVKSGNHTDSIIKNNYIEVFKSPTVDFNATNTSGCNPLTVQFTDLSAITDGHIMARQWDFGDGLLSAEQNPGHTYNLTGNFNVTLKVTAVNGCMSALRKTSYINNHDTKAAFRNWGFSNCSPNKIVFQNESTGNGNLQKPALFTFIQQQVCTP